MSEVAKFSRFPVVARLERSSRRQRILIASLAAVALAFLGLRVLATIIVDRWWSHSVTDAPLWRVRIVAQSQLFLLAFVAILAILGTTIFFIWHTGRRVLAPNNRVMHWYHARMGLAHHWLVIAIGIYVAWRALAAVPNFWQQWILFRDGFDLSNSVPGTGGNLGSYIFSLPFLNTTTSFLRQLTLFSFLLALAGHSTSGAFRWSKSMPSRRAASAHLLSLAGFFLLVQTFHYLFVQRRLQVLNSTGGFVGAGYTQTTFVLPGLWITAIFAALGVASLIHAITTRETKLAKIGLAVWAVIHMVALVALPAIIDKVVVAPAEGDKQLTAIGENLVATRTAYGLGDISESEISVSNGLPSSTDAADIAQTSETPIFDVSSLAPAVQILEGTSGTRVTQVDLDRYEIDGTYRALILALRQPDRRGLPESGWVKERLVYTHGGGVIVASATHSDKNGRPDVAEFSGAYDLPPVYFGEGLENWWAIVNTKRIQQGGVSYTGDLGIKTGSFFKRTILGIALRDLQIPLSSELTSESEILLRRGIKDRLTALAPFLSWDSDPYAAIVNNNVVWIVDGYTTSNSYPYSQSFGREGLPSGSDIARIPLNYMRSAVRAVIDADTGTTTLYESDIEQSADPILTLWKKVLPDLIEPADSMSQELRDHLRYPKDLFIVQSSLLGRYHVSDAESLFNGQDRWTISPAPGADVGMPGYAVSQPVFRFNTVAGKSQWSMIRTYNTGSSSNVSAGRDVLSAMIIASNDSPQKLQVIRLNSSDGNKISSPQVAQSAIDADPELARIITLLNTNGSQVRFGPMTPLIVKDSLVWTRSMLITGTGGAAVPRVYGIIAVANGVAGLGETTELAIAAAIK